MYLTPTGIYAPTPADIDFLIASGNQMVHAGLQIPIPEEHQDGALPMSAGEWADAAKAKADSVKYNRGFIKGFRKNSRGNLETLHDIPDLETFRRLCTEIQFVSPEIRRRVDRTGKDWGKVITHVALTPIPIWHEQRPYSAGDIVRGGDGFSLEPVGAPVKLPGLPVRLSAYASEAPIRLSLSQMVVERNGEWFATRMAVSWEPHTDTKTGKQGWKSVGGKGKGQVRYGSKPGGDKTAPKAAPAKAEPVKGAERVAKKPQAPASPAITVSADSATKPRGKRTLQSLADAIVKSAGETRELPKHLRVTESSRDTSPPEEAFGKLGVLTFAALAKEIDPPTDITLKPAQFKNVEKQYKVWQAKYPKPEDFAVAIRESWKHDRLQVSRGRKRTATGASYAARELAYRYMLQWADEDVAKAHKPTSAAELNAQREGRTHEERMDKIAKGEKLSGIPFRDRLINQVISFLPQSETEQYQHAVRLLASKDPPTKAASIVNAVKAKVGQAIEDGDVDADMLDVALNGIAEAGYGRLKPEEVSAYLHKHQQLSLANLRRDRATRLTRLSNNGGNTVADEPETKDNDELFDDDEIVGDTPAEGDTPAVPAEGGEDELLKSASDAAAKKGIMVPADAKNCKEWIQHFITAMNTHQATSEQAGAGGGGDTPTQMDDSMAMQEQPQVGMAMSAAQVAHHNFITGSLANERLDFRKRQINVLVKKGKATPAQAKQWLAVLEPKRLSLACANSSGDVARALAQIDMAKSIPSGTYSDIGETTPTRLSAAPAAKPAEPPEYARAGESKQKMNRSVVDRLSGGSLGAYEEKLKGQK